MMSERLWANGLVYVLCLAVACLTTGCGLTTIDVEVRTSTVVRGASPLEQIIYDMDFGGFSNLDLTDSSALANQGVDEDDIHSAILTELSLEVTEPSSGQDLAFMESVQFTAKAGGVEQGLVARGGSFEAGESLVELETTGLELKPYLVAESMDIITDVSGRLPPQDTTIEAVAVFEVEVNLRGLRN